MTKKPSATIEAWIARDLPDGMGLVDPTHDADGIERSLHPELAVVRETAEQARTSRVPPGVPLVLIDAVSQREVPFATSAIRELREMNRAEIDAESRAYKTWLDTIPGARLLVTQGGARGLGTFQGGRTADVVASFRRFSVNFRGAMQTHRYVDLPQAKGSFGYLPSDTPPSRLVVFVHGFAGDAWATWINFHIAIMCGDAGPGWSRSDVFFYDYPSMGSRIDIAADNFATFFSSLVPPNQSAFRLEPDDGPSWLARRPPPARRDAASYEEIVLIGHSEGGVIVRQAVAEVARLILDVGHSRSSLAVHQNALLEAKLRLFAPAIAGAGPAGLKGAALRTPVFGHLASIFLGSSRAYPELQPTSRVLEKLETRTERYWKSKNYPAMKAAIAWGAREEVVELVNYDQDDPIWREPDHNHVSICKPVGAFDKPLFFADTGTKPK